jgi:DNA-binding beta-propeller fold protein YncE
MKHGALFLIAIAVTAMSAVAKADDAPLVLEAKIPLGAVSGRIDHFAVDLAHRRLFVAELGNNSVGAIDLASGTVAHRLTGLAEPQGLGYFAPTDRLFVANGGDGSLRLYRGADLSLAGRVALGKDADNVRIDPTAPRVWVGYGDGALAALDAASGKKLMDIPLKAHPESFRFDAAGGRIFVNVPDAHQIAIVDPAAGRQIGTVALPGVQSNFPMALDAEAGRMLSVFRSPPRLIAVDTANGKLAATFEVCGDADDVFVDAKRRRIYISCGAGAIDVLAPRGDGYERVAHIATVSGARTSLFVPELDRLYVAVRAAFPGEPAAVWVFRPTP